MHFIETTFPKICRTSFEALMTIGPYPASNGLRCNTIHLAFVVEDERDGKFFQHRCFTY